MITETHLRTLCKTVTYRILSTIAIMLLSLLLGATGAQAGMMGIIIFVLGTIIYYAHDRVWAKINLWRATDGDEHIKRSLVKTILYRLITVVLGVIIARLIMTDSNTTAMAFGIGQFIVNMILYYILERVFNRVQYGRVVSN